MAPVSVSAQAFWRGHRRAGPSRLRSSPGGRHQAADDATVSQTQTEALLIAKSGGAAAAAVAARRRLKVARGGRRLTGGDTERLSHIMAAIEGGNAATYWIKLFSGRQHPWKRQNFAKLMEAVRRAGGEGRQGRRGGVSGGGDTRQPESLSPEEIMDLDVVCGELKPTQFRWQESAQLTIPNNYEQNLDLSMRDEQDKWKD